MDYLVTPPVNKKTKLAALAALLLIVIVVIVFWNMRRIVVINKDTTINGDFTIGANKEVILKNGAKLSVLGDMVVKGVLACDGGSLPLVVRDSLTVKGRVTCVPHDPASTQNGIAVAITAKHISFDKNSQLSANGHIELTTDAAKLLSSEGEIARAYEETAEDTVFSTQLGPFIENRNIHEVHTATKETAKSGQKGTFPSMELGGMWSVGEEELLPSGVAASASLKNTPGILVLLDVGEEGVITLQDLRVVGTKGGNGADDIAKKCSAEGGNGANAFRMRVSAKTINLNNFTLELSGSGNGGSAETTKDCGDALARGGAGGEAGNFKMTAVEDIRILNFILTPGRGGNGGNALAFARNGENGCPSENGGNATGVGGVGGKSKKELLVSGAIAGIDTIKTGRVVGGKGGDALAIPGKGGSGTECGCNGGKGGNGSAAGGKGGDAFASVPLSTIEGHGGDGGSVDTRGGHGGNGGSCPHKQSGGDGGVGGEAKTVPGAAGRGVTANGNGGIAKNQSGGDGGAGGDGCNPGIGGQGGIGAPIGAFGPLGKNMCTDDTPQIIPKEGGPALIRAILYRGKYLPVDQLIIENEAGCGAEHWHATQGTVKATNGEIVSDPGFQCGFGKVKDNPSEMVPKDTVQGTLIILPDGR